MSSETSTPSLKDAIDEQAQIIVSLQGRLKAAIARNNAPDSKKFSQAVLAATQTWTLLIEALNGTAKPPVTPVYGVAKTYRGQP